MKNLFLTAGILLAVIFGCNLSPTPDFSPQHWRPAGPGAFQGVYEKVSILMQGGFYDESSHRLDKNFCIGTNFEKPANTLLESIVLESGDSSYPALWEINTTLDGDDKYSRKECGHIFVHWDLDRSQGEIFKQGAQIVFNLKLDGIPESVKMEIVPTKEYKVE